jgi:hypothetical protein
MNNHLCPGSHNQPEINHTRAKMNSHLYPLFQLPWSLAQPAIDNTQARKTNSMFPPYHLWVTINHAQLQVLHSNQPLRSSLLALFLLLNQLSKHLGPFLILKVLLRRASEPLQT